MKMNIALIVIGIVLIVVGIVRMVADRSAHQPQEYDYVSFREPEPTTPQAASPLVAASEPAPAETFREPEPTTPQAASPLVAASEPAPAETSEEWAKRVGNEFENFVANFFANRDVYTVLEWNQGLTSTEGVYAEADKNPDFKIKQEFGKKGLTYWVECKYRTRFNHGSIVVRDYQLNRYRLIQRQSRRKIFLAIGVGDNPSAPDEIFIVPLDSIDNERIRRRDIEPFKMQNPRADLAPWVLSYFEDKVFVASRSRKNESQK